jgi:hypothetical protein
MLESLKTMRKICARCAEPDVSLSLRASCQDEMEILKEDVSRLSRAAGFEFSAPDVSEGTKIALDVMDEAINKLSGAEKMAGWMNELLGDR